MMFVNIHKEDIKYIKIDRLRILLAWVTATLVCTGGRDQIRAPAGRTSWHPAKNICTEWKHTQRVYRSRFHRKRIILIYISSLLFLTYEDYR